MKSKFKAEIESKIVTIGYIIHIDNRLYDYLINFDDAINTLENIDYIEELSIESERSFYYILYSCEQEYAENVTAKVIEFLEKYDQESKNYIKAKEEIIEKKENSIPKMEYKMSNGEINYATNSGTALNGAYVYYLPTDAIPTSCAEPNVPHIVVPTYIDDKIKYVVVKNSDLIPWTYGHRHEYGPGWKCPYCVTVELNKEITSNNDRVWIKFLSGEVIYVDLFDVISKHPEYNINLQEREKFWKEKFEQNEKL